MKIHTQWWQHVEAWHESGLSQADYCRQQGLNPKTLSAWARRCALPIDKDDPVEVISVQVTPSAPATTIEASAIMLRFPARLRTTNIVSKKILWFNIIKIENRERVILYQRKPLQSKTILPKTMSRQHSASIYVPYTKPMQMLFLG